MEIKKVVVIGSGTMGSGIAAHLCNANITVTLLDLTTEISEQARERIKKSRPPLLIDKSKIDNIDVGNINDNFNVVSEADWVVEAVVERIDIKHNIYEKIFKERKAGSIISSNTSSIPISVLSEKLSVEDKKDFCITHFFNPVRYMDLLEIVKSENNDLNKIDNKKILEAINLETGEYHPSQKINIKSDKVDLKALINRDDKYGEYAWSVISKIMKEINF